MRKPGEKFGEPVPAYTIFDYIIIIIIIIISEDQRARSNSALYVRISPQWLRELKQLWTSDP